MTSIEKQIADEIARANGLSVKKLGLRVDKTVIRLIGKLRAFVELTAQDGETVLVTVTAPIRLPAKTERALEEQIKDFLESGIRHRDRIANIFQNEVGLRIVRFSSKRNPKLIGLVHNPGTASKLLLDLAVQWLSKE